MQACDDSGCGAPVATKFRVRSPGLLPTLHLCNRYSHAAANRHLHAAANRYFHATAHYDSHTYRDQGVTGLDRGKHPHSSGQPAGEAQNGYLERPLGLKPIVQLGAGRRGGLVFLWN